MYRFRSLFAITVLAFSFTSCIESFHPDIDDSNPSNYVIDGSITDVEGIQTVWISKTSTLNRPDFNPVTFCKVEIIDNLGNVFKLDESTTERGKYSGWIGKENLVPGRSFQLKVVTAGGLEIISDFDQMPECPDVDSIYAIKKAIPTDNPLKTIEGMQFYIDVDRKNTNSRYFKWEIAETWEHHAAYPITWHLDKEEGWVCNLSPDFSKFKCYSNSKLDEYFTLSMESIPQSKFKMNALHFVDNQTQRLTYCYSALVNQYAISEPAFRYWDNLRKNSGEQGGLFNTQPVSVKGNLKCPSDPEQRVLGFFGAYSIKSKRIIVLSPSNIELCQPTLIPPRKPTYQDQGYKYMIEIDGTRYILEDACVECDFIGGSTVKPNYWPI